MIIDYQIKFFIKHGINRVDAHSIEPDKLTICRGLDCNECILGSKSGIGQCGIIDKNDFKNLKTTHPELFI